MNESYFKRRLMEELKAAEQSATEHERSGHLRGCYLLCSLLGLNVADGEAHGWRKRRRVKAMKKRRSA